MQMGLCYRSTQRTSGAMLMQNMVDIAPPRHHLRTLGTSRSMSIQLCTLAAQVGGSMDINIITDGHQSRSYFCTDHSCSYPKVNIPNCDCEVYLPSILYTTAFLNISIQYLDQQPGPPNPLQPLIHLPSISSNYTAQWPELQLHEAMEPSPSSPPSWVCITTTILSKQYMFVANTK